MKFLDGFYFYNIMHWWLKQGFIFREIVSFLLCIITSAVIFGFLGVSVDGLLDDNATRFAVWTTIGFLIFKFMFSMSVALAQEYERVKKMSTHDTLTGLYSMGYLSDAIELTHAHAQRSQEDFCVFLFDGNNIKSINDRYGHKMGNKAIRKISERLKELVYRHNDIIIRFGGDEFLVLCSSKDVQKMYDRMINEFSKKKIVVSVEGSTETIALSATVGMAHMSTTAKMFLEKNPEELYQLLFAQADLDMYKNKEKRRQTE